MEFEDGCFLVFGKETKGLPKPLIEANMETCMRIPMLKLEKGKIFKSVKFGSYSSI